MWHKVTVCLSPVSTVNKNINGKARTECKADLKGNEKVNGKMPVNTNKQSLVPKLFDALNILDERKKEEDWKRIMSFC